MSSVLDDRHTFRLNEAWLCCSVRNNCSPNPSRPRNGVFWNLEVDFLLLIWCSGSDMPPICNHCKNPVAGTSHLSQLCLKDSAPCRCWLIQQFSGCGPEPCWAGCESLSTLPHLTLRSQQITPRVTTATQRASIPPQRAAQQKDMKKSRNLWEECVSGELLDAERKYHRRVQVGLGRVSTNWQTTIWRMASRCCTTEERFCVDLPRVRPTAWIEGHWLENFPVWLRALRNTSLSAARDPARW